MITNEELIQKRRSGRREIIETFVSQEEILRVYRETHSMRETATKLKIALRTVFKYVRRAKASFPVGQALAADPLAYTNNSQIARDLDALCVPLPHSIAKIVKLLENRYSSSAVYHFLKTRQRAAHEVARSAGRLLDYPRIILRDIYGRTIPVGSIAQYELSINRFNLNLTIEATLKFGGKIICRMSLSYYRELLEGYATRTAEMPPKEFPETTEASE